jgi:nicotinamide riboside transporter PnuC
MAMTSSLVSLDWAYDTHHLQTLIISKLIFFCQVTIARIFNWDVHQRRSKQSAIKETWSSYYVCRQWNRVLFVRLANHLVCHHSVCPLLVMVPWLCNKNVSISFSFMVLELYCLLAVEDDVHFCFGLHVLV